jgi:hypothetical protein
MLFWFDRLQYSTEGNLIIFEFFETDISNIDKINLTSWNEIMGEKIFDKFTFSKHKIIREFMQNNDKIVYYLIIYSDKDNEKKIVLKYENSNELSIIVHENFIELQKWFLPINAASPYSKPLGQLESKTTYGHDLIYKYWGEGINKNDDQGRILTEKLLTTINTSGKEIKNNTSGFDFDLFIYLKNKQHLLNIELAYNKKAKNANTECTPMKYCWGNGPYWVKDNKRKYNQLWNVTQILNGKFAVLNYTDEKNDKNQDDDLFGFSIINNMSYTDGFLNETKYRIKRDNFEKALDECIKKECTDFSCFKNQAESIEIYEAEFFSKWSENRKKYR